MVMASQPQTVDIEHPIVAARLKTAATEQSYSPN